MPQESLTLSLKVLHLGHGVALHRRLAGHAGCTAAMPSLRTETSKAL